MDNAGNKVIGAAATGIELVFVPELLGADLIPYRIESLLATLPDNPDDIASMLAQEGCFGSPGRVCRCPLAKFLQKRLPGVEIKVYTSYCRYSADWEKKFPLSGAAIEFVKRLDAGKYPFLATCE